jgi:hypothetical protein
MCGHDMVLIAALPAEDGLVLGFEQQTLQCRACGETLHRFVFVSGVTAADAETGTNENQKPALATNGIENAMRALNGTDQAAFIANGRANRWYRTGELRLFRRQKRSRA